MYISFCIPEDAQHGEHVIAYIKYMDQQVIQDHHIGTWFRQRAIAKVQPWVLEAIKRPEVLKKLFNLK